MGDWIYCILCGFWLVMWFFQWCILIILYSCCVGTSISYNSNPTIGAPWRCNIALPDSKHIFRVKFGEISSYKWFYSVFFYFVIYFSVSFLFLCFVLFLINQISGAGANICTNLWVVRWYISLDQIILCLPEIYCVIKYNLLYFRIVCNSFDTTFPPLVAN